ncbi:MAG: hypothetical protein E8D47_08195 [Nitrospira sp.]|nr:MAG: hypothetical protein E8D47_08195 [Nitrospira sp.]
MLKRTLILLTFILAQAGCTFYEEHGSYQPSPFVPEAVQHYERLKRDLLQLEDLKVGEGPVAAAGRKVIAEIVVRYSDGSLVYEGPAITYWGMIGDLSIHNNVRERGLLSTQQLGIVWGLNGMAVGGKRRIVVSPNLVCYEGAVGESLDKGANPNGRCGLVYGERDLVKVRKEQLTVEATLTASCTPIFLRIPLIYSGQFRCRDSDAPKRKSGDPIWRFYHAASSKP